MKKNNSPGSLPEIVEAINRAYDLAFSLVSRLRSVEAFATQAAELTAVAFFERDDEEQRIGEAIAQAKGKLFDRRSDLQDLCSQIEAGLEELREAFSGVVFEVFEFSYAETNDFETTGDRTAYASLTFMAYAVRRWIGETIGFLSMVEKLPVALNRELATKCNDLAEGIPMTTDFERAIRKRLLFEKSVFCRNAKAFAESKGIIGTTTPQGRKKAEKTPDQIKTEKSYLSLLAEYEKWQEAQRKKTGRQRPGPSGWLEAQDLWTPKSKRFFDKLSGPKDEQGLKILTDAIKYARKIRKQASGD